ncbi:aminodeoxychorismate lyase [Haloechinothrix sp. YIM 98757]|uniref:Aminodeoxychorismate lyase n=1 Tax=Haloechinothrix aidingensis TaxID=2752311 RepID=A0A838A5T6_9PSEU|nr:aminodeoxychorismate lyase [Haloechinothrix aidingensis]MBA0124398.1 aminodeoxychorismate lyase [Haloechinothrix aidingensis]
MRVLIHLDGSVADPDTPQVRVDDLGLLRGDGVFETVLVSGGHARELDKHLDRLERSAGMLDMDTPDRQAWQRAVAAAIERWPEGSEMALKLVYTRGLDSDPGADPTAFALGIEVSEGLLRARAEGIAVVTLERGIDTELAERAPWLLLGAKSLSYGINMAAMREAERRGAEDVIFTAGDGTVLEGPIANVVVADAGTLYTPPPSIGILPGTTQAGLFRAAERAGWSTKIEPLRLEDLRDADGVFLTSSIRKVTRIHTLDGEQLPDSRALHAELAAAYESEYPG